MQSELVAVLDTFPLRISTENPVNICHRYHIKVLALFGSILRDDFSPSSEVDVLIDLAPTTPIKRLMDRAQLVVDLEGVFG